MVHNEALRRGKGKVVKEMEAALRLATWEGRASSWVTSLSRSSSRIAYGERRKGIIEISYPEIASYRRDQPTRGDWSRVKKMLACFGAHVGETRQSVLHEFQQRSTGEQSL